MACDHDWTIKFFGINDGGSPFEIRPRTLSLKLNRNEFDYCQAEADPEVGEMMKPHTRYKDGKLYGMTKVGVCYNGHVVQYLLFQPDYVDYGSDATHLRFHDLQKSLTSGSIEWSKENIKLREAYRKVIEAADNDLINGIKFTIPENLSAYGTGHFIDEPFGFRIKELDPLQPFFAEYNPFRNNYQEKEASETDDIVDSWFAVNFEDISPLEAVYKLNEKYRIVTSINRSGELVIGSPEVFSIRHLAAEKDPRVWRFKDPNISHSREPLKRVEIEGNYLERTYQDEKNPSGIKKKKKYLSYGIAERQDINYGTTLTIKSPNPNDGSLKDQAVFYFRQKIKEQNKGSVEIDPNLSGNVVSSVIDLDIGHLLHLIPNDDNFDNPTAESGQIGDEPNAVDSHCQGYVKNEAYTVTGLEHTITEGGDWQVHTDVSMYPDVFITGSFELLDPTEDEFINNPEEVRDSG